MKWPEWFKLVRFWHVCLFLSVSFFVMAFTGVTLFEKIPVINGEARALAVWLGLLFFSAALLTRYFRPPD